MESGQERSLLYPHDVTGEITTRLKSSHHMASCISKGSFGGAGRTRCTEKHSPQPDSILKCWMYILDCLCGLHLEGPSCMHVHWESRFEQVTILKNGHHHCALINFAHYPHCPHSKSFADSVLSALLNALKAEYENILPIKNLEKKPGDTWL